MENGGGREGEEWRSNSGAALGKERRLARVSERWSRQRDGLGEGRRRGDGELGFKEGRV